MRIDTIPEGALLMYDNNQQSALGVKNCKVNNKSKKALDKTLHGERIKTLSRMRIRFFRGM
jgi:hypothetical protein